MKKFLRFAAASLAGMVFLATSSFAQVETGTGEGEVRRIDKAASKVTLRHGPLAGLDMPAMTMVFQAKDPTLLDRLKVGDRIRFITTRDGKAFTLDSAEPVQ